jgi:hypothetical protein
VIRIIGDGLRHGRARNCPLTGRPSKESSAKP